MKCPYCDSEMEEGFVQSGRDIIWGKEKHKVFFTAKEDEITIAKGINGAVITANYCISCKKIIINCNN